MSRLFPDMPIWPGRLSCSRPLELGYVSGFRSFSPGIVHNSCTASGHRFGRAPCELPGFLRDGKGLCVLVALPLNGFFFVLLK